MEFLSLILFVLLAVAVIYIYKLKFAKKELEVDPSIQRKVTKTKIANFFIKSEIHTRLQEYREYTAEIESKFESDKKSLRERFEDEIKDYTDEDRQFVEEYYAEDYSDIEDTKTGLYRRSTLVSLYTYLESSMHAMCLHAQRQNDLPVGVSDIRGEGIIRSKTYLELHSLFDITPVNGSWSTLNSFNKIRNCLVHCNGDIATFNGQRKIKDIVSQNRHLSLKNDRLIIIEKGYVDLVIEDIEKLLLELHKQVFTKDV